MKLFFLGPSSGLMKTWCSLFADKHEVLHATIPDRVDPKLFNIASARCLTDNGILNPNDFMGRMKIATRVVNGTKNFIGSEALQPSYARVVPRAAGSLLTFLFQFSFLDRVRRIVSEEKPDFVEGHYLFPYGALAAFSRHQRIVVCAWGSDVLIDCARNPYLKMLARKVFEKVLFAHGECAFIRNRAVRLGCPEEKFFVVPWGVDLELFSPQNRSDHIRAEYDIASDAPVIVSDRALAPIYKIDKIIRGFALVKKRLPEARLMILNDGVEKVKLLNLCKELAISDSVHFTGMISREELPLFLTASNVYVQMPVSDSLSLSLQEAMACGLPIITSKAGGNPEAVCGNGFLVNDHLEMAEKLLLILRHNIGRDLGKTSRQIAEKRFDRKANSSKMEALYKRLV